MGLLVGSSKASNKPASKHYFGFNINFNDVPYGNANALHIHRTFEYFMAFSGDFEIRAGHDARSSITLNKFDTVIVPAFFKRFFKCVATEQQMHRCEEMLQYSDAGCALILAGIVGPPWVQWSEETISEARKNKVLCTNAGVLYDGDAEPPKEEPREEELDCSQEELEACVLRAADRPVVTKPYGDGDMRFEYVDVYPGAEGAWKADSGRNYCAWLLEGPELAVQESNDEHGGGILRAMETLVMPKGQEWQLRLPENSSGSTLIYLISGSMTDALHSQEVLDQMEKALKVR